MQSAGPNSALLLHDFFLLGTNRSERGARLCFVFHHAREQAAAKRSTELRLVVAKCGIAKCR